MTGGVATPTAATPTPTGMGLVPLEGELKRERTIYNERVKLAASTFNTVGTGSLGVGIVTPFATRFWIEAGVGSSASAAGSMPAAGSFLVALAIWLAVMIALNTAGMLTLGLMKEP